MADRQTVVTERTDSDRVSASDSTNSNSWLAPLFIIIGLLILFLLFRGAFNRTDNVPAPTNVENNTQSETNTQTTPENTAPPTTTNNPAPAPATDTGGPGTQTTPTPAQ